MKSEKILICGLPGSGKTYFAERLQQYLIDHGSAQHKRNINLYNLDGIPGQAFNKITVDWFNADDIRKKYNDWDFSNEGRIRQSLRMAKFALECTSDFVICDFVAPLQQMRENFAADWTIWMDTITEGRFEDTNKLFQNLSVYDFRITEQNADRWVPIVGQAILNNCRRTLFDSQKPTVQMLGRWQPWHAGHRALFERLLKKTGQVCIMIRDCKDWQDNNPFDVEEVQRQIRRDLDPLYQGQYSILVVPNIVHIGYGRKVGYSIGEEFFDEEIEKISGTEIRKSMFKNS